MKQLGDIIRGIKERFTNPLIFSFVISWLAYNWQITIAMLWYDRTQIAAEGCRSVFEFIQNRLYNTPDSFWLPVKIAIGYTFLIPIVRNLIQIFYSFINKWGTIFDLKVSGGGKVRIEKYLQVRDDWKKRTKILERVINEEESFKIEVEEKKTEIIELEEKIKTHELYKTEQDKLISGFMNHRFLDGLWNRTIRPANNDTELLFGDGQIYGYINGSKQRIGSVRQFYFNNKSGFLFFLLQYGNPGESDFKMETYELNRQANDFYTGSFNYTTTVELKKKE